MNSLPPGSLILIGSLFVPLLHGRTRVVWTIGLPCLSFLHLLGCFPTEHLVQAELFQLTLIPIRVDRLSLLWGSVFHLAAILAWIYAMHVRNRAEHAAAMMYVGASIGCVFAGDLLTLFIYWEMTAISSAFLILAGPHRESLAAGLRYLAMHVASGVLVLAGALLIYVQSGSLSFGGPGELGMYSDLTQSGAFLLLIGFGIKAAFPLLHWWLPDAYPRSTVCGIVFLSAFTTKMAIYALARGFSACEPLVFVGVAMALFPLIQAVLADDMRTTLVHILNNQLGFMVVAVGIGTQLAINGVAAQACAHILYKGLLFMAIGAVLTATGTARQSQLGGLWKQMPWTSGFCLVGALAVVPLNCGFVTKSLVMNAVAEEHLKWPWILLMVAAVGAFLVTGIKVPYFTFFAQARRPERVLRPVPKNMTTAMAAAAGLCLLIGIFPQTLYRLLPHELDYHPYDVPHIVQQLQLLAFTLLAFSAACRFGWYPQPISVSSVHVKQRVRAAIAWTSALIGSWNSRFHEAWNVQSTRARRWMDWQCSEAGYLGGSASTNAMAISAALLLAIYLVIYY